MNKTGRRPRIHVPNTIYHVMTRGNNRQRIFYEDACFEKFIEILSDSTKKFDHKFLAYCFMTNHTHMLLHVHNESLSSIMQYINYRYVRWFNGKYNKVGHLFQDRYRSIAVSDDDYLINLCRYIHHNPIKAGMVNDLNDYLWSSHKFYVVGDHPAWMEVNFILAAIKNKTNKSYLQFISQPVDRQKWKPAMYLLNDGKIIFDEEVIRKFDLENDRGKKEVKKIISEQHILYVVCQSFNTDYQSLCAASRKRSVSNQRVLLADLWMKYSNLSVVDIAKRLNRTHGTLLRQLEKFNLNENQYISEETIEKIYREIYMLSKEIN